MGYRLIRQDELWAHPVKYRIVKQGDLWARPEILEASNLKKALEWCFENGFELIEEV